MKKLRSLVAVVVALAGVGQTIAASSVDLSVKGTITPSACTPLLSNGGIVDHGKVSAKDLIGTFNPLPPETLKLKVDCVASTLFAIKSTDNRQGTSADSEAGGGGLSTFGIGLTHDGKKIGWYTLKLSGALADGVARPVIESFDGHTWMNADTSIWQPSWLRSVYDAAVGVPSPMPVQTLVSNLVIETTLRNVKALAIDQDTPIDGSATLDIVYL